MAKLSLNKVAKRVEVAKSTPLETLTTEDFNKKFTAKRNAMGH